MQRVLPYVTQGRAGHRADHITQWVLPCRVPGLPGLVLACACACACASAAASPASSSLLLTGGISLSAPAATCCNDANFAGLQKHHSTAEHSTAQQSRAKHARVQNPVNTKAQPVETHSSAPCCADPCGTVPSCSCSRPATLTQSMQHQQHPQQHHHTSSSSSSSPLTKLQASF
jgi:hypothetical protein